MFDVRLGNLICTAAIEFAIVRLVADLAYILPLRPMCLVGRALALLGVLPALFMLAGLNDSIQATILLAPPSESPAFLGMRIHPHLLEVSIMAVAEVLVLIAAGLVFRWEGVAGGLLLASGTVYLLSIGVMTGNSYSIQTYLNPGDPTMFNFMLVTFAAPLAAGSLLLTTWRKGRPRRLTGPTPNGVLVA